VVAVVHNPLSGKTDGYQVAILEDPSEHCKFGDDSGDDLSRYNLDGRMVVKGDTGQYGHASPRLLLL
jgi:hypothetical protein